MFIDDVYEKYPEVLNNEGILLIQNVADYLLNYHTDDLASIYDSFKDYFVLMPPCNPLWLEFKTKDYRLGYRIYIEPLSEEKKAENIRECLASYPDYLPTVNNHKYFLFVDIYCKAIKLSLSKLGTNVYALQTNGRLLSFAGKECGFESFIEESLPVEIQ